MGLWPTWEPHGWVQVMPVLAVRILGSNCKQICLVALRSTLEARGCMASTRGHRREWCGSGLLASGWGRISQVVKKGTCGNMGGWVARSLRRCYTCGVAKAVDVVGYPRGWRMSWWPLWWW
jgi:hypothetical protein